MVMLYIWTMDVFMTVHAGNLTGGLLQPRSALRTNTNLNIYGASSSDSTATDLLVRLQNHDSTPRECSDTSRQQTLALGRRQPAA